MVGSAMRSGELGSGVGNNVRQRRSRFSRARPADAFIVWGISSRSVTSCRLQVVEVEVKVDVDVVAERVGGPWSMSCDANESPHSSTIACPCSLID